MSIEVSNYMVSKLVYNLFTGLTTYLYRGYNPFTTWNPKQPFINGCFNWMIPNLYIGKGCFTKHLFKNGCLGFQVSTMDIIPQDSIVAYIKV